MKNSDESVLGTRKPRTSGAGRWIAHALVLSAGVVIARVDSRPGWDDTGITVASVVLVAAIGVFVRVSPLVSAVLAAGPLVLAVVSRGAGVLLALPFALAGAGLAALVRSRAEST